MSAKKPIPFAPEAYRVADLIDAGIARDRLKAHDIRRFGHGLLLHPDSELDLSSYRDRCLAFAQTLQPHHFVSRRSAATLLEVPCPVPTGGRVDVGAIWPVRAPRRPEVHGHRVKAGLIEWREVAGVGIPSPADVWCQLSAVLAYVQLVAAGDFLISGRLILNSGGQREPPLTSAEELARALERYRGTPGGAFRRRALAAIRRPVDSPAETELRLIIVRTGLPEPVVSCPVPVEGRVLHADLGYPRLRIAIEYEGAHHFQSVAQVRRDARRHELMREAGWTVLRVMLEDLRDPRWFLRRLVAIIEAASVSRS